MVLCATLRKTNSVLYNHNGYNPHKGLYPLFLFLNENGFEEKPYSIRQKKMRERGQWKMFFTHINLQAILQFFIRNQNMEFTICKTTCLVRMKCTNNALRHHCHVLKQCG